MNPKVHDKATLLKLLVENTDQLHAYGVKKIGLFGSFVRDKDIHKKSDVDLVVDFQPGKKKMRNLLDLGYFLEDLTGRKVELLTRPALRGLIGPYIAKELEDVKLTRSRRHSLKAERKHKMKL